MTKAKTHTQQINKNTKATVLSANPQSNLDEMLWAINWFDLKHSWLYNLYNLLVIKYVKQVGGRPLFKGKLRKVIQNQNSLHREVILIVSYPKADAFLKMISIRAFQLKSVLRLLSVENFVFGFHTRLDDGKVDSSQKVKPPLKFLVLVTTTAMEDLDATQIKSAATQEDVFTHFIGSKTALLGVEKENEGMQTIPFPITHVLVFSAFEDSQIERFADNPVLSAFRTSDAESFIGIFDQAI